MESPPVDMTAEELEKQRKRKDRERKRVARRKARIESRAAYLAKVTGRNEPWKAAGISKASWYRRRRETGSVRTPETASETGSVRTPGECETGSVRGDYLLRNGQTLSHLDQAAPPNGLRDNTCFPDSKSSQLAEKWEGETYAEWEARKIEEERRRRWGEPP